jgi:hypothetical protein
LQGVYCRNNENVFNFKNGQKYFQLFDRGSLKVVKTEQYENVSRILGMQNIEVLLKLQNEKY